MLLLEESIVNNRVFWIEGVSVEKPNKIFYNSSHQEQTTGERQDVMAKVKLVKDKNLNHTHLFWNCLVVQIFWKQIHTVIHKAL